MGTPMISTRLARQAALGSVDGRSSARSQVAGSLRSRRVLIARGSTRTPSAIVPKPHRAHQLKAGLRLIRRMLLVEIHPGKVLTVVLLHTVDRVHRSQRRHMPRRGDLCRDAPRTSGRVTHRTDPALAEHGASYLVGSGCGQAVAGPATSVVEPPAHRQQQTLADRAGCCLSGSRSRAGKSVHMDKGPLGGRSDCRSGGQGVHVTKVYWERDTSGPA